MRRAVLFLGLIGCSGSKSVSDGGSDAQVEAGDSSVKDAAGDGRIPPRAAVNALFNPADAGCSGKIFSMGTLPDTLVDDGAGASVACGVHPMGGMFTVTVTVNALGSPAGLDLVGTVTATGPQKIDVMLRDMTGMPVMKMMCAGTYPMNGGVSAGKLWIKLACMASPIDPPPSSCAVEVEARVENCTP